MFKRSGFWLTLGMVSFVCMGFSGFALKKDMWGHLSASTLTIRIIVLLGIISIISMIVHVAFEWRDTRKRELHRRIST